MENLCTAGHEHKLEDWQVFELSVRLFFTVYFESLLAKLYV